MHIHVIGGGTVNHVRPHLAVSAPAYGTLACNIASELTDLGCTHRLHLTRMALGTVFQYPHLNLSVGPRGRGATVETNAGMLKLIQMIVGAKEPSLVFMTAAVADWDPLVMTPGFRRGDESVCTTEWFGKSGEHNSRLRTSEGDLRLVLTPADKLIRQFRGNGVPGSRKDIFLVACKTTTGATDDEMFLAGLNLLKTASCNLVLVNDTHRLRNMIVTPEQARYGTDLSREEVTKTLVDMARERAFGTFTRSTVVPGDPVAWTDERVHPTLRAVVDHCIEQGAYKDLLGRGATVGHFAQKLTKDRFLTSRRNSDFNQMAEVGLVEVESNGDDTVTAYGFKPSVGGQSQRIIFREHPETDCIIHFHCPMKPGMPQRSLAKGSPIPVVPQWANECGSHQCGQNTSKGLGVVLPGIKAVYLKNHGPNIVFHHDIDPQTVINFIDRNFDLSRHTGEA